MSQAQHYRIGNLTGLDGTEGMKGHVSTNPDFPRLVTLRFVFKLVVLKSIGWYQSVLKTNFVVLRCNVFFMEYTWYMTGVFHEKSVRGSRSNVTGTEMWF